MSHAIKEMLTLIIWGQLQSVLQNLGFVLLLMLVTMFFFLPEMSLVNAIVRWTCIWY